MVAARPLRDSLTPKPSNEPTAGALKEEDLFPESALWNVGNTRPPQNLRHFDGDEIEATYLKYFATGDMHSYRHGTKVRVEGSTTHPAQLELLRNLFGRYANPIFTPIVTPQSHYAIRATFDLSSSFGFLLNKLRRVERRALEEDPLFYGALSGFSDAESHVGLSSNYHKARAEYTLFNMNRRLLEDFLGGLLSRGYSGSIYASTRSGMWQLYVHAAHVPRLLPKIQFRHPEKIVGKHLAMKYGGRPWSVVGPIYKRYRKAIIIERNVLETIAARRFGSRADRKRIKREIFRQRVESTFVLFRKGLTAQEVADSLHCSIRTAYRRREKFEAGNVSEGIR